MMVLTKRIPPTASSWVINGSFSAVIRVMKRFRLSLWLLALCACWLPVSPLLSADKAGDVVTTPALVTRATLEARLKEVEASTKLDEDARAGLVETINKALGNLEAIKTSQATTEGYVQARKTALDQARVIREQQVMDDKEDSEVTIKATTDSPFDVIEAELLQEKANLAAVQAKLSDLRGQLDTSDNRPSIVQQQLLQAKQDKESLEAELKLQDSSSQTSGAGEANRWSLTTRIAALRSEIGMLDQELLSMPMRVELLEAQRDRDARNVKRVAARVKMLEELSSRQGHVEAEQARQEAAAAVSGAAGKHAFIQELAEKKIDTTKVKIIWTTPDYPDYHWTVRGDLDMIWGKGFTARLRQALLDISDPDLLSAFPRNGFIPTNNDNYHAIAVSAKRMGLLN